jgi:voltage-gated potassium channel
MPSVVSPDRAIRNARHELLNRTVRAFEPPMMILAVVWFGLLVVDATGHLPPFLVRVSFFIWALFVLQFVLEISIAPDKRAYLRKHWLTALALIAPAFRLLAVLRLFSSLGEVGALGILAGVNRGMDTVGRITRRRGFGYAMILTMLVTAGGAAAITSLERGVAHSPVSNFGDALWWSAMAIATVGTDYSPKTPGGRLVFLLLATFGLGVFGYITASIASVFVANDAEAALSSAAEDATREAIAALHKEVLTLREEIRGRAVSPAEPRSF